MLWLWPAGDEANLRRHRCQHPIYGANCVPCRGSQFGYEQVSEEGYRSTSMRSVDLDEVSSRKRYDQLINELRVADGE